MSETPDRPIASGNVAEVFARGSRILKLYKQVEGKAAAFREAALHAAVEAMGLPVPALWGVEQVGDRWGVIFDRVEGSSFAERIRNEPEAAPGYLDLLVRLQLDIHSQPGVAFPNLKRRLAAKISRAPNISEARRRSLLAKQADLANGDRDCCRSYLILKLHAQDLAESYLDAYRRLGSASRDRILAWLPSIAAARLAEEVCGEAVRLLAIVG